jgi:guanylate kinase
MLTVLYGPSCVGKTTLINRLITDYSWKPISCYLTRTIRPSDVGRVEITREKFQELENDEYFHCVNHHFETSYGTPKHELTNAENCKTNVYILDFMIKNYSQLEVFEHDKIIILPESLEKFKSQIETSGRSDRTKDILKDLEENYNEEKIMTYKNIGFKTIINKFNDIDATLSDFCGVI